MKKDKSNGFESLLWSLNGIPSSQFLQVNVEHHEYMRAPVFRIYTIKKGLPFSSPPAGMSLSNSPCGRNNLSIPDQGEISK